MQKSESIGNLAKALTAVQSNLTPAKKDSQNPFFKSQYADLNSVWDSCRSLLAQNGLSVIQGNSVGVDNTVIVETILAHESGEWIQSELCLPLAKHDPQGVGSAVTYGRRYGLAAIVGIVADADDDGNAASNKNGKAQSKPQNKTTDNQLAAIQVQCKKLNEAGDSVKWGRVTLNDYTKEVHGVALDDADAQQLTEIQKDLAARLVSILQEAKNNVV